MLTNAETSSKLQQVKERIKSNSDFAKDFQNWACFFYNMETNDFVRYTERDFQTGKDVDYGYLEMKGRTPFKDCIGKKITIAGTDYHVNNVIWVEDKEIDMPIHGVIEKASKKGKMCQVFVTEIKRMN